MSIYLKQQECKVRKIPSTAAVQICGDPPYEIALRFANCCLRCLLCFAAGYSYPDKFRKHKDVVFDVPLEKVVADYNSIPYVQSGKGYNWFRILGGEPLLNNESVEFAFNVIQQVADLDSSKINNGVVIQTNGIYLGRGHTELLYEKLQNLGKSHPNVLVVIETSIKGTNPSEFEIVAQASRELYQYNIQSYFNLKKLGLSNLRPMVVAGFGLNTSYLMGSDRNMISLHMNNQPFYHPDEWDAEFSALYQDYVSTYSTLSPLFHRMPMYGIEDRPNWRWAFPALKRGKKEQPRYFYDKKYDGANLALESKFKDIKEKFFFEQPNVYYPAMLLR